MTDDPVHTYLVARRLAVAAAADVTELVAAVRKAADDLRQWPHVEIANIAGVAYPLTGAGTRERAPVMVPPWPTAAEAAQALARWQQAHQEAVRLYDALSEELKQGLQPPPAST